MRSVLSSSSRKQLAKRGKTTTSRSGLDLACTNWERLRRVKRSEERVKGRKKAPRMEQRVMGEEEGEEGGQRERE